MAAIRRHVRGREAQVTFYARVRPEFDEALGDYAIASLRGDVQRGAAILVDRVQVHAVPVNVVYRARVPRLRGVRGVLDVSVSFTLRVPAPRRASPGNFGSRGSLEGADGVVSVVEGEGPEAQ